MQNAAFGPRPRWAAQRLSKVVDLGGGGVVGYEPGQLLACNLPSAWPGTEPSRGPQPITVYQINGCRLGSSAPINIVQKPPRTPTLQTSAVEVATKGPWVPA